MTYDFEPYDFHEESTLEDVAEQTLLTPNPTEAGPLVPVAAVPVYRGALQSPPPVRLPTTALAAHEPAPVRLPTTAVAPITVGTPITSISPARVSTTVRKSLGKMQAREQSRAQHARLFRLAAGAAVACGLIALFL